MLFRGPPPFDELLGIALSFGKTSVAPYCTQHS